MGQTIESEAKIEKKEGLSKEQKEFLINELYNSEDVQFALKVRLGEEKIKLMEDLRR